LEESIGFAAGDDEVVQRKKTPKASSYAQVSNLSMAFSDDPEAGVSERNKVTLKESSESGEVESIEAVHKIELPGRRFCEACQVVQPYRSRHCWECNKCVRKFDHHCFWIGGCVGELNHGKFWLFLFTQTLSEVIAYNLARSAHA